MLRLARSACALSLCLLLIACGNSEITPTELRKPSILLVTLDTTRADSIGPEATGIETPAFNALAARGVRFRQAYTTSPQTLPSHSSMLTGLYPAGHGVHENGRYLSPAHSLLSEKLRDVGYRTAAFVSAFAVARRFGLARGFGVYDEDFPDGRAERTAKETTDRVLAYLDRPSPDPLFLWVHYYDPHYPYTPPDPFRKKFANKPYLGEVAAMDEQLGRLVAAFEQRVKGPVGIVVVADHGEGLGDHGEDQHGNLLYQSTMHVPMVVVGPGFTPQTSEVPVSIRRVYHTIRDWVGLGGEHSLRGEHEGVVLGEAMKPFLDYGWQPQVVAVQGRLKTILAGRTEIYDVIADPGETRDLSGQLDPSRAVRAALRDYPNPNPGAVQTAAGLDEESRRQLASLGYVSATARPAVRKDAPRPIDMAPLFLLLDRSSALFVREQYSEVIPLLEQILEKDPHNLDAALRLATAHSSLGHDKQAIAAFQRAESIAPNSSDVRTYLALHHGHGKDWEKATPLLERVLAEEPDRLPALEGLAVVRERQGRLEDAVRLRTKIYAMRAATGRELARLGEMQMHLSQTMSAIESFEKARRLLGSGFQHDLELGVLYLAAQRFPEARDALDRVPSSHPDYPMTLFKRAQVSVLLREPDHPERIARAQRYADATTRDLIARERLFQ